MDLDEAALNTLLAEGIDLPTAVAGSAQDHEPGSENDASKMGQAACLLFALVITLFLFYWLS